MLPTLREKAVSASLWSGMDSVFKLGIQFCITIVLARLLTPEDYGTVGLLAVFIGLAGIFIESGFSAALIQRKDITDTDTSSVFYFNILIACIMASCLYLAAKPIARFYGISVLVPFTRLMVLNLVIGSFGTIQRTLLTRELNFRKLFMISVTAVIVSGLFAIILAWKGYGIWSLGVQSVSLTAVSTLLLWIIGSWRPKLLFSLLSIRNLFRFGGFLLFAGLLDMLYSRLNTLVIGKFYSPRDLGYYSRADGTQQIPAGLLANIISKVAFPIFSAGQGDKNLLRSGLKKAIMLVMLLNIPIMIGLAVTADMVIVVLFGEKWLPAVVYLRILSLGGLLWPLHVLNLNILKAQGKSALMLRLEIIKKFIGIGLLAAACSIGIQAIAWSIVVTSVICFGINAFYSGKFLGYGTRKQARDLAPYLAGGVLMGACVQIVSLVPVQIPALLLVLQVLTGLITYTIYCRALHLAAFDEMILILRTLRSRRTANSGM
jgi:teichuronic acid exporter